MNGKQASTHVVDPSDVPAWREDLTKRVGAVESLVSETRTSVVKIEAAGIETRRSLEEWQRNNSNALREIQQDIKQSRPAPINWVPIVSLLIALIGMVGIAVATFGQLSNGPLDQSAAKNTEAIRDLRAAQIEQAKLNGILDERTVQRGRELDQLHIWQNRLDVINREQDLERARNSEALAALERQVDEMDARGTRHWVPSPPIATGP